MEIVDAQEREHAVASINRLCTDQIVQCSGAVHECGRQAAV
jgi:hypothetical protein